MESVYMSHSPLINITNFCVFLEYFADLDAYQEDTAFENGCTPAPFWEPYFCVLLQDVRRLSHSLSEKVQSHTLHHHRKIINIFKYIVTQES